MTFDEFIAKWTDQPVDFDGVYPNQCMDLMHQYCFDVLGITDRSALAQPAAYQVFTNYDHETGAAAFDKITNTPQAVPVKGDIVFFGQTIGPYGHVCIFVDGTDLQFNSFDANWPLNSLPHIQHHSYQGVIGWLHFKQLSQPAPQPVQPPLEGDDMTDDQKNALDVLTTIKQQNGYGNLEGSARAGQDAIMKVAELEATTSTQIGTIATQNTLITQLQEAKEKLADQLTVCQATVTTAANTSSVATTTPAPVVVPAQDPLQNSVAMNLGVVIKQLLIKLHVIEGK